MSYLTIEPTQLKALLDDGKPLDLIDVRTPMEHRTIHVAGTRLMPLNQLDAKHVMQTRPAEADGPCYVLCKSGSRSKKACETLAASGLDVVLIAGGTDAYAAAGFDVVRGQSVMSLERQVRIAAGALVFVFTLLGATFNPWLLAVPAFVGAGLVFAGVTDTCGMGMMLAKMPWNQVKGATSKENCELKSTASSG